MIYVQTVFIYILLMCSMIWLSQRYVSSEKRLYLFYAALLYGIIFGIRYGVGNDYLSYVDYYDQVKDGSISLLYNNWEIGYYYFNLFLSKTGLTSEVLMFGTSFLPVLLILIVVPSKNKDILPFLVLAFMLSAKWLQLSNVLRQSLAIGFILYSLRFIVEKKPLHFSLLVLLAFTMHKTAIVFFVLYPLYMLRNSIFNNVKIVLMLLAMSLVAMNISYIQNIIGQFDKLLVFTGYEFYSTRGDLVNDNIHIGLGFFLNLGRNVMLIMLSQKVKTWAKSRFFDITFDIYVIGILLSYSLWGSILVSRFSLYMTYCEIFVSAYTLTYLYQHYKNYYKIAVISLYLTIFLATISRGEENTSLFVFNGQTEYYYYKRNLN